MRVKARSIRIYEDKTVQLDVKNPNYPIIPNVVFWALKDMGWAVNKSESSKGDRGFLTLKRNSTSVFPVITVESGVNFTRLLNNNITIEMEKPIDCQITRETIKCGGLIEDF